MVKHLEGSAKATKCCFYCKLYYTDLHKRVTDLHKRVTLTDINMKPKCCLYNSLHKSSQWSTICHQATLYAKSHPQRIEKLAFVYTIVW